MKTSLGIVLGIVLLGASGVHAQYVEIRGGGGESTAAGQATLEVSARVSATSSGEARGKSGEKGRTEDITIGVGELQESAGRKNFIVQHNQTDLEFLRQNPVAVQAVEVRGWDPKQKQEFLATVKAHAQVQSGQDLENFAKGVLLEDDNMEQVSFNFGKIVIKYRSNGKLFGFIPLSYTQKVELDAEGDDLGKIKVKMPWYSLLIRPDVLAADIESEASKRFGKQQLEIESWSFGERAEAFNTLSNILKTKHDTVKNSINNVR